MIARSSVLFRACFLALLAAALTSLAIHAQPPPGDGLIKPEARTKVSEHVHVILDQDHAFVPERGA